MPVHIKPSSHGANAISLYSEYVYERYAEEVNDLIQNACRNSQCQSSEVLQSSFKDGLPSATLPSPNGLVYSAIVAYNKHHHLTMRPEDVWFAILTQFSAYINAHAESFRP